MRDLLYLCHRIPYPPDKGEKIRAWNQLLHLARSFRIHLGCLVDDPADWQHVDTLRSHVATVGAFRIDRTRQKLRALLRARPGRPLMPDFYASPELMAWTEATIAAHPPALTIAYTAAVAPYVMHRPGPKLLDLVDIDSEKWAEYALTAGFPMRLVWAREARTLLRFEEEAAARFDEAFFVTHAEATRFTALVPALAGRIDHVENGVDLTRFAPSLNLPNPYPDSAPRIVFAGHMDYWPNADAVVWFATEILPLIRAAIPTAQFCIAGANPTQAVRDLAQFPGVQVTGRIADIRPYIAHAALSASPLRIARGIQNKVLEAMAMGIPVLATQAAFEGVDAVPGRDLLVADGAGDLAAAAIAVLSGQHPDLAANGRRLVETRYSWESTLKGLDEIIRKVLF